MFFKITNWYENHNGFQYQDGLNVLIGPFNDDPSISCCEGGLYFTDSSNILDFLGYGCFIREVFLPWNDPDFKMVKDNNKWRANKIILGKKYDLWEIETLELLKNEGVDIYVKKYEQLLNSIYDEGDYLVIKFLIDNDVKKVTYKNFSYKACVENDYEIMKYLIEKNINLNKWKDHRNPLYNAIIHNNYKIVKLLVKNNADINIYNEINPLYNAAKYGRFKVVKFLIKNGAKIHYYKDNINPLYNAMIYGHYEIVKYLVKDININININIGNINLDYLYQTLLCGHQKIVHFLVKTIKKN